MATMTNGLLILAILTGICSLDSPWGSNSIIVISPPVGGLYHEEKLSYVGRLLTFVIANMIGAFIVGYGGGWLGVGLFGGAYHGFLWLALLFLSLIYGCSTLFGYRLYVPTRHWQIPRSWGTFRSPWPEFTFGFALGAGFLTVIPFIGIYLLIITSVLIARPIESAFVFVVFGFTRSIFVFLIPFTFLIWGREYSINHACEFKVINKKVNRSKFMAVIKGSVLILFAAYIYVNMVVR